jgi:hypothetical protein
MAAKGKNSTLSIWVAISILSVVLFIAVTRLNKVVNPQTLSKPVQSTITAIMEAGEYYKADQGVWPESFAELKSSRFLTMPPGAESGWTFEIIGSPPEEILAVSTNEMTAGAGKEIRYDLEAGLFSGYGIDSLVLAGN